MYATVCQVWHRDPAAYLEEEDDVLAVNLRTALAVALVRDPPELDEAADHRKRVEEARRRGAAVRSLVTGG